MGRNDETSPFLGVENMSYSQSGLKRFVKGAVVVASVAGFTLFLSLCFLSFPFLSSYCV